MHTFYFSCRLYFNENMLRCHERRHDVTSFRLICKMEEELVLTRVVLFDKIKFDYGFGYILEKLLL